MAHIELLNDNSMEFTEKSLKRLCCKRDDCNLESSRSGMGTLDMLGADFEDGDMVTSQPDGPITPCVWP